MEKYIYQVEAKLTKFYINSYDFKEKKVIGFLKPLMIDDQEESAFFYRVFESQNDAKICFDLLCSFCTSSEIQLSVEKSLVLNDSIIGCKELGSFVMQDEDYSEKDIQGFLDGLNWDTDVPVQVSYDVYSMLSQSKE